MALVELPYNQLVQWVIARGKTPEDCNKRLIAVEELCKGFFEKHTSIPQDVKDMQRHVHCEYTEWYEILCDITERLKSTEDGKKVNFIGQYSYEPLYDADKILRAFRKNNLHIVSYSQVLQKQMTFNLPFIKKGIESNNKELSDYKARRAESLRKLNANINELQNRLKVYCMDIKDYPFNEDFEVCLKTRLTQEIAIKNANMTIHNYHRTLKLVEELDNEVVPVFKAFVKYQKMDKNYHPEETMKHIRQAVKHGLEYATNGNEDTEERPSDDANAEPEEEPLIQIVKDDNELLVAEDKRRIIFSTQLGQSSFRQLLLGELLELLSFVKVRIDELQNRSNAANYIFSQSGENVNELIMQPISKYEKYIEVINEVIEILSGTDSMKALSILKNRSDLEKSAQGEISIWKRCCKEVAEQSDLDKRIQVTTETLKRFTSDLESARKTIKDTKAKLEKATAEVMGSPVKIFGEIDNI